MNKKTILGVMALLISAQAWASEVAVSGAWVRATASGQDNAAVSLHITSQKDARIVGVTSPISASAEIHTMTHENGMMMMRPVDALALPAKKELSVGDGEHIMLIGLKHPLKAGDSVPLTVTIEFADKSKEKIAFKAEVKSLTESHDMQGMPGMPGMHDMHGMH